LLVNRLAESLSSLKQEVKDVNKFYKGTVEGNVIRLEKQIGLSVGTQILVMLNKTWFVE